MKKYLVAFLLLVLLPKAYSDERPHYINYQAAIRDDGGNPITSDTINLEFRIIDQDGTELYKEIQRNVQVVKGAVNVLIGEGAVLNSEPPLPTGGIPLSALDPRTGTKFLRVTIGDNLPGGDMEIGINPFSMWSEKALSVAEHSIGSDEIKDSSIYLRHLAEPIRFSNITGQIAESQIPAGIATDNELNAHINKQKEAHQAEQIGTKGLFNYTSGGRDVNTVLHDLDWAIVNESQTRHFARQFLTGRIDTEVTARTEADTSLQNSLNTHLQANTAHGSDGTVVGLNTLNNAISTHASQTQGVHGLSTTPGNQVVGTRDTQELYDKTLINPVIQGGQITENIEVAEGVLIDGQDISAMADFLVNESATRASADSALGSRIDGVSSSLASEASTRAGADTALGSRVDGVNTSITTETNARTSADTTINGRIDGLQTSLASEASTRAGADTALGTRIDGINTAITTETNARTSADTTIHGRIDTLHTNLNNHTSATNANAHNFTNLSGTLADSQIPGNITRDSELNFTNIAGSITNAQIGSDVITSNKIADGTILLADLNAAAFANWDRDATDDFTQAQGDARYARQSDLASEVSTRASADTALGGRIDGVMTSVTNEASTRASADTTLQNNIDGKVSKTGDTMTGNLGFDDTSCPIIPPGQPGAGSRRCLVDGVDVSALEGRVTALGGDSSNLRTALTTVGNLQPTNCVWSDLYQESDNVEYICPLGKIMVGRQHFGDENGDTRYYCCNLILVLPASP